MTKFTSETARKARRIGIEKKEGLKLLVYMRPMGKKQVITGFFRGNEVSIVGNNNPELLDKLCEKLKKLV